MHISIIIPFVNNAKTIRRLMESLLTQQLNNSESFEIVAVNNRSRDKTQSIIQEFQNKSTISIKIIEAKKKQSPGYARNMGLLQANGNWITLVDADDHVAPGWLEALCSQAQEGFIVRGAIRICDTKTGKPIFSDQQKQKKLYLQRMPWITTPGIFVEKKLLMEALGWDESLMAGEDYELGYRLMLNGAIIQNITTPPYFVSRNNSPFNLIEKALRYAKHDVITRLLEWESE